MQSKRISDAHDMDSRGALCARFDFPIRFGAQRAIQHRLWIRAAIILSPVSQRFRIKTAVPDLGTICDFALVSESHREPAPWPRPFVRSSTPVASCYPDFYLTKLSVFNACFSSFSGQSPVSQEFSSQNLPSCNHCGKKNSGPIAGNAPIPGYQKRPDASGAFFCLYLAFVLVRCLRTRTVERAANKNDRRSEKIFLLPNSNNFKRGA